MEFDRAKNSVILKAVYYGPALGGKTTNLQALHDSLPPVQRGDLVSLDTHQDRTLFFDMLPFFLTTPSGLRLKLKTYTVPGQVRYDATRKAVLSGADGVAFIADSQVAQQQNNAESLGNLEDNCRALGLRLGELPLVIQFNKRDLEHIVSEEEVHERWDGTDVPLHFASAIRGEGVAETFMTLCRAMYARAERELDLCDEHGLTESAFLEALGVTA